MKSLVTGCCGFIGSHLTERLLNEGHNVIGIDCFSNYYSRSIKENNLHYFNKNPNFTFIEQDILNADLLNLTKDVDYIFHQAAQAGVRASWGEYFSTYTNNNILVTQKLLEAAKQNSNLKKFIYASSSSIYGDVNNFPIEEKNLPYPISPYGVSKLAGEHLVTLYAKEFSLPSVSLRYFTVYGPRQRPDMAFHKFIKSSLTRTPITIYGDGSQTRDFTFINDIIEANILVAYSDKVGEVYNVGGGSRVSLKDVLNNLFNLIPKVEVKYIEPQKGDVKHTAASIKKIQTDTGYTPKVPLLEGLKAEIDWLQNMLNKNLL